MNRESIFQRRPRGRLTRQDAETVATDVLGALAADPDRLGAFLAATGLDPATIRKAASGPDFLAAVLDHIAADEPLLVAVASETAHPPDRIMAARHVLSPGAPDDA